jgi:mRNA-degrading endonuclease RelE of RelBE toxin-antitoxin system
LRQFEKGAGRVRIVSTGGQSATSQIVSDIVANAVLAPTIAPDALKYINSLDQTTKGRIKDKILELAKDPFNIRLSKPLRNSNKRTARVGNYRILFVVIPEKESLLISAVGPRGDIYRQL